MNSSDYHVVAVFNDPIKADRSLGRLIRMGITQNHLSLLVNEVGRSHHFQIDPSKSKTAEGVGYGAVLGGLIAGLGTAAAGIVSVTVPGAIFIAGPLAVSLASAATGAAVGGLAGGLIGVGIPADEVSLVEGELGRGSILVAAHGLSESQKETVSNEFRTAGAVRVH